MDTTAKIIIALVVLSILTASITMVRAMKLIRSNKAELNKRKQILTNGIDARATINSIRQTNSRLDEQPVVLLDLTLTKENGEIVNAVIRTAIPVVHIPDFQKGKRQSAAG
jgi:hypothetical protein